MADLTLLSTVDPFDEMPYSWSTEDEAAAIRDGRTVKILFVFLSGEMGADMPLRVTMAEAMRLAGDVAGMPILPPPGELPLDGIYWAPPDRSEQRVEDLKETVFRFLARHRGPRRFAVDLRRVFQVNSSWLVAEAPTMTPRAILQLFGQDPDLYDLYKPGSPDALPKDTAIAVERGDRFEAQRKGRVGDLPASPLSLVDEVAELTNHGLKVRLVRNGNQTYLLEADLSIPAPPWSRECTDILIPLPLAYQGFPSPAALDAFRVAWPIEFNGGVHPRIQSPNEPGITVEGRLWRLVSWHYPPGAQWCAGVDRLSTHINHCHGFFLGRETR